MTTKFTDFENMTDEEKMKVIEDCAIKSAQNMGAPTDLWHPKYGWVLRGGKATEAYKEFYEKELMHLKPQVIPPIVKPTVEAEEDSVETPFYRDKDASEQLNVGMLLEILQKLPKDYLVSYDSALGHVRKGDFTIYHDEKKISING